MNCALAIVGAALLLVAMTGKTGAAEGSFAEQLARNATWQARSAFGAYEQKYPNADNIDDRRLQGKLELSVKTESSFNSSTGLVAAGFVQAGTPHDTYHGALHRPGSTDPDSAYLDFTELYLKFSGEKGRFSAGKALIPSGLATLYSPANRFHNVDAKDPADTRELGVWQFAYEHFLEGNDSLKFAVITHADRTKEPRNRSRWVGSSGSYEFTSVEVPAGSTLQRRFPQSGPDNFGYLLTYKAAREGMDYFVTLHHGFGAFPVLRRDNLTDLFVERVKAATLAVGFAATRGKGFELHGEAVYQHTYHGRDQDFARYVLGVNYDETDFAQHIGLDKIKATVEYAVEDVTGNKYDAATFSDSSNARPFKNAILWKLQLEYDSKRSIALAQSYNLDRYDHAIVIGGEYRPRDSISWKAVLELYNGASNTQFGRWDRNDRLVFSYTHKF